MKELEGAGKHAQYIALLAFLLDWMVGGQGANTP